MIISVSLLSGCAGTLRADGQPMVEFSRRPISLPEGGCVDVLRGNSQEVVVGIKGVKVLWVETYGGNRKDYPDLAQENEWTTFVLEKGDRFNFTMLSPKDGKSHFALVSEEDNEVPPHWLGVGIAVTKDYGSGSSMTARAFYRK